MTAVTNYHKLAGLQHRNLFSCNLESWNLEFWNQGICRAVCLPQPPGKNPFLSLPVSAGCWQYLVFFGLQWQRSIVCLCCHVVSFSAPPLFLCLIFPLIRKTSDWFRAHPNPVWPHLNLIISTETLFPKMVTFISSEWTWILGNTIQPSSTMKEIIDKSFDYFL